MYKSRFQILYKTNFLTINFSEYEISGSSPELLMNFDRMATQYQTCSFERIEETKKLKICQVQKLLKNFQNCKRKEILFQDSLNECLEKDWSKSLANLEERIDSKFDSKINAVTTKIENLEQENFNLKYQLRNKSIFFDFGLKDHISTSGSEVLKFDLERTSSPDKPYNSASGVFSVSRSGLHFFHLHYLPKTSSGTSYVDIFIDEEVGCRAYSTNDYTSASCAIVRYLEKGQHVFVKKYGQIYKGNPTTDQVYTGFMGVLLQ